MTKASKSDRTAAERLLRDLAAGKAWLNAPKGGGQDLVAGAPPNRWEQLSFEQRLALANAIRQRRRVATK